jgi:hypothetical protein
MKQVKVFSFLFETKFLNQVLFAAFFLLIVACSKNSYDDSVANEELMAFKKELVTQTQEIRGAMNMATNQVLSNPSNPFDLNHFKTAFDNAMIAKSGTHYNSTLQPYLKLWNTQKQPLDGYLADNKASQAVIIEIQDIVSQIGNTAHQLDGIGLHDESDLTAISTEIKNILANKEVKCFKSKTFSDIEAKIIVTVTTVLSGTVDELLNLCTNYYQNNNSGLQTRGWFTSLLKVVVNALITAVVVVAVTVAIAALVYFTAGAGAAIIGGAVSFPAFLGSGGIVAGLIGGIGAGWSSCSGMCIINEDPGYRCFCR